MSDLWEPGPVESFPERSSELADSLYKLQQASMRAAQAMRWFHMRLQLMALGLDDWNDEMDNCYPNIDWPDP